MLAWKKCPHSRFTAVLAVVFVAGCGNPPEPATQRPFALSGSKLGLFEPDGSYEVSFMLPVPAGLPPVASCSTSCGCFDVVSVKRDPADAEQLSIVATLDTHDKSPGRDVQYMFFIDENGDVAGESSVEYFIQGTAVEPRFLTMARSRPGQNSYGKFRVVIFTGNHVERPEPLSSNAGIVIAPVGEWTLETVASIDGPVDIHSREFLVRAPELSFGEERSGDVRVQDAGGHLSIPIRIQAEETIAARPAVVLISRDRLKREGVAIEFISLNGSNVADGDVLISPGGILSATRVPGTDAELARFHLQTEKEITETKYVVTFSAEENSACRCEVVITP